MRNLGGAEYARGDEQRVRDHLGSFGFEGGRVFEPVGRFSGGEKARLTLALLVARRPNLLLLDEPTNHLDIDMRHALNVALQNFAGGMLLVSHDRHLIKSVADSLWLVADGKLSVFQGDLDDYQQWLKTRGRNAAVAGARSEAPRRAAAAGEAARARSLVRLRREMQQIETRLAAITVQHARVEAALCEDPLDAGLQTEHAELTRDAAAMEAQWLEAGTALETAEAAAQTEVSG